MTADPLRRVNPVVRLAPAKLNLTLAVLGRRRDGFHDLHSVAVPLALADRLSAAPAPGHVDTVHATGHDPGPPDANLVLRAVTAARSTVGRAAAAVPLAIRLEKHVPVAAGLGGGSSDAAATLLALDELWSTGLDRRALARVGSTVGSDVPALLAEEPVFARGRGELVEPVLVQSSTWVVKTFDLGVSSTEGYAWWDERSVTGPDPGALIAAAETGNDELLGSALFNDLQDAVIARHPEIAETIDALVAAGAYGAVMSGSGPTVVALCSYGKAQTIAEAVPGGLVVDAPPKPATPARIDPDPSGVV